MRFSLVVLACTASLFIVDATCPESCHCNIYQTRVVCKGQKSIPKMLPVTTEYLSLVNNFIREINAESFKNLINLKTLILSSNKIYHIRKDSFLHQSKLTSLNLRNNDLQTIENGSFVGASSLMKLYLTSNRLTNIPCLYGLTSLKTLLLNANQISEVLFTHEYRQLKQLSYINLSNNKINQLTVQSLINLEESNVKKISFSRNQITNIEPNTFQILRNITSMNLAENTFTASVLKDCLYAVRNYYLLNLDLSSLKNIRDIKDILEAVHNIPLKTLILSKNYFSDIPSDSFNFLNSLEVLKLDFCSIINLEDTTFANLTKLRRLFLNGNYISKLTIIFPPKLLFLYLNSNTIQKVPNEIFGQLSDLLELHLQYNRIVQFDDKAFIGLRKLRSLKLQHNRINVIPGQLFSNFAHLLDLEIGSNAITNIPETIFIKVKLLHFLDLSNNQISKLPRSFSTELTQLKILYLNSNKLGQFLSTDQNGFLLNNLISLETIDLSYNKIKGHLFKKLFQKNTHLKSISLRGNKISGWENNTFKSTNQTLKKLDMSNNYINTVNSNSLKHINHVEFNISMNPFACNCDLRWFRDWLNTTTAVILNKKDLICNSPPHWQGKCVFYFSRDKIDCKDYTIYFVLAGYSGGFLLTVIIVSVAYTKRWYIRLKMLKLCENVKILGRNPEYTGIPGDDVYFDAYISYCNKDSKWVANYLVHDFDDGEWEGNKNNGNFKLCFRDRDFILGNYVTKNIDDSLQVSKKVLVVLTPHFKKDKQCEFELSQGIMKHTTKNVMPIVICEELKPSQIPSSLKYIFETNQFLEWNINNSNNFFKRKLEKFLSE